MPKFKWDILSTFQNMCSGGKLASLALARKIQNLIFCEQNDSDFLLLMRNEESCIEVGGQGSRISSLVCTFRSDTVSSVALSNWVTFPHL